MPADFPRLEFQHMSRSFSPTPSFSESATPAQAASLMQQPMHDPLPGRVARQQQQNNGIPEFQPRAQQGGQALEDGAHTLSAYLERASRAGEMPGARVHDIAEGRGQARKQQQQ